MDIKRTILSLFMILVYVHSFAHGSLPHNGCNNHESSGLLHDHQSDDLEDADCSSRGLIHSFVHLIESLAHNQFAHDEPLVFESNSSKFLFLDCVFILDFLDRQILPLKQSRLLGVNRLAPDFLLLHNALRGPPVFV